MREKTIPPNVASLSESIRDMGYSPQAAIADLIDNSITALARKIQIILDVSIPDEECLAIVDDGSGMTEAELLDAMRLGSRNPREIRDASDLGRFGLGLKTASFSQCRSLTVVSRRDGNLCAARWDLDLIAARNEWIVQIPSGSELAGLPFIDALGQQGTYVLWQKLDRFHENVALDLRIDHALEKLRAIERHLSLVFHRYLSGEYGKSKLQIELNGTPVKPSDPYFTANRATQLLNEETVRINGSEVKMQAFIIPYQSKLTKKEKELSASAGELVTNQGAYVYRNGRLLAWGGWFGLIPRGEATKLARVRIDFTNALDEAWTVDIKKSRAEPPLAVRKTLKQIIGQIAEPSKRVIRGRAKRLLDSEAHPMWFLHPDRVGMRFAINREHPLVAAALTRLDPDSQAAFEGILRALESNVPVEAIYADYTISSSKYEEREEVSIDSLRELLIGQYSVLCDSGLMTWEKFTPMIRSQKPFKDYPDATETILQELSNG